MDGGLIQAAVGSLWGCGNRFLTRFGVRANAFCNVLPLPAHFCRATGVDDLRRHYADTGVPVILVCTK
jgi:hypothetical protein